MISNLQKFLTNTSGIYHKILSISAIHTSNVNKTFWERSKKAGYEPDFKNISKKKLILDGLKELKQEIALWRDEVTEKLESDPILVYRPGSFVKILFF